MLFYTKFEYCFYTKNETVLFSSPSLNYLPVRLALCCAARTLPVQLALKKLRCEGKQEVTISRFYLCRSCQHILIHLVQVRLFSHIIRSV